MSCRTRTGRQHMHVYSVKNTQRNSILFEKRYFWKLTQINRLCSKFHLGYPDRHTSDERAMVETMCSNKAEQPKLCSTNARWPKIRVPTKHNGRNSVFQQSRMAKSVFQQSRMTETLCYNKDEDISTHVSHAGTKCSVSEY